jgi:prophage regulatory protein
MQNIDLISPNQVMARLDIPSTTLYRWISEGRFPRPIRIGPRRTAFRVKEIEEWLDNRAKKITPELEESEK